MNLILCILLRSLKMPMTYREASALGQSCYSMVRCWCNDRGRSCRLIQTTCCISSFWLTSLTRPIAPASKALPRLSFRRCTSSTSTNAICKSIDLRKSRQGRSSLSRAEMNCHFTNSIARTHMTSLAILTFTSDVRPAEALDEMSIRNAGIGLLPQRSVYCPVCSRLW